MKIALILCAFVATAAFAETKTPVVLSKINFDGETLKGSYVTGGGCLPHSPQLEINLRKTDLYSGVADLQIFDITTSPDNCEALLGVNVEANLKEMVSKKAEEMGLSDLYFSINLPVAIR